MSRCTFGICIAVISLSACSPQSAIKTSAALPLVSVPIRMHATDRTWMDAGAARWDLLYVTNANGLVNVYRYWQHTLTGILSDFDHPEGECSDAAGNVYIADSGARKVYEYAHGAKRPIKTIEDSGYDPYGCAVNLKSGDLAVANFYDSRSHSRGNIAIYRHASGKAVIYDDSYLRGFRSCAYDDNGNLLATDGNGYSSSSYGSRFVYLPKKAVKLISIDFSSSGYPFYVQAIQWDGKYWVIDQYEDLYQLTISGRQATFVGTIELSGAYGNDLGPFAFYRPTPTSAPTQVVGSTAFESRSAAEYWRYPAGGDTIASVTQKLDQAFGVAISRKQ